MATRKKLEVVPDEPLEEEQQSPYNFEPVDEELQSQLNVLGNMMQNTRNRVYPKYPEWARMIDDMFNVIGAAANEHTPK